MRGPSRVLAVLLTCLSLVSPRALAERIVFQRGETLYVTNAEGREARRLFVVGRPFETRWAPSPDGRRVAWTEPLSASPNAGISLADRPVAIFVADLSGLRRKRLLVTNNLRDRRGNRVTRLGLGDHKPVEGAENFSAWLLDGLAWSADGRSLYLSCALAGNLGGHATFVVDSSTGAAVVDAEGRWRSIGPVTDVDARGALLIGVTLASTKDSAALDRPLGASRFRPLLIINLAEEKTTSLLPATFAAKDAPTYAGANSPALSPDTGMVVFGTFGHGLWLVDTQGRNYRALTAGAGDDSPRWSSDGKRILYLSHPAGSAAGLTDNLYDLPVPDNSLHDRPARRLLIRDIVRFFVVPD